VLGPHAYGHDELAILADPHHGTMVMVPQTSLSLVDAWLPAIMVCISIVILLAIHLPHKTGQC
jgi:hypothetical protein